MILDFLAYFLIVAALLIAGGFLLLFVTVYTLDGNPSKAKHLLFFALLLAGFVWALFRLGVM